MLVFFTISKIKAKGRYEITSRNYPVHGSCRGSVFAADKVELKTQKDKVSYAIGMDVAMV
jgi:hypothetical protein